MKETRNVTVESAADPDDVTKSVTPSSTEVTLFDPASDDAPPPVMPEVQEHAINAARTRLAEEAGTEPPTEPTVAESTTLPRNGDPVKGATDVNGRAYDPVYHIGEGVLNREGYLKKRPGRGGSAAEKARTNGAARSRAEAPDIPAPGASPEPVAAQAFNADVEAEYAATAAFCSGMFFVCAQLACGDDFKPEGKEQQEVSTLFHAYFKARGIPAIPPEIALIGGLSFVVVSRWNRPGFQERRATWLKTFRKWQGKPDAD